MRFIVLTSLLVFLTACDNDKGVMYYRDHPEALKAEILRCNEMGYELAEKDKTCQIAIAVEQTKEREARFYEKNYGNQ